MDFLKFPDLSVRVLIFTFFLVLFCAASSFHVGYAIVGYKKFASSAGMTFSFHSSNQVEAQGPLDRILHAAHLVVRSTDRMQASAVQPS